MSVGIIAISFVVILFVVITIHELGHFITARRAGVVVEEFGLGLPPRLFGVKRGDTLYSVNAVPLGAFVRSVGEDDPMVPGGLASKGPWSRLAVYAAGPLFNILLAFLLLTAFFALPTDVIVGNGAMIYSVREGSPAEEAGIEAGDIILAVGGEQVHKWSDVQSMVNTSEEGEQITMLVEGDDGQREVSLVPGFNSDSGRKEIGVTLSRNLVSEVEAGTAGYDAGIRPGDTIININGHYIYSSESVSQALASVEQGGEVHIVLLRGQEQVVASMIKTSDSAQKIMGVELYWVEGAHIGKERSSMWEAMCLGGSYIVNTPQMVAASIPLIKKDPSLALVGPIGAGQMTVELVRSFGFSNMLFMGGVISLGIALFNFIPMPPLDGGGMLIGLIEGIRRGKRLSRRALHLAYSIGTSLLIAAIVLITYSDILRLVSGKGFGW